MGIEWREFLAVGVEEIDEQHKELFSRVNDLLAACDEGKGADELLRLLTFLDEYALSHFAAEEKLQQVNHYPDYLKHRDQHKEFIGRIADLKQELSLGNGGLPTVISTSRFAVGWLTEHISKVDKALGDYLRTRNG